MCVAFCSKAKFIFPLCEHFRTQQNQIRINATKLSHTFAHVLTLTTAFVRKYMSQVATVCGSFFALSFYDSLNLIRLPSSNEKCLLSIAIRKVFIIKWRIIMTQNIDWSEFKANQIIGKIAYIQAICASLKMICFVSVLLIVDSLRFHFFFST